MTSIYHFFNNLIEKSNSLRQLASLDHFLFNYAILEQRSPSNKQSLVIKSDPNPALLPGGELIELYTCPNYKLKFLRSIPSSTIRDDITNEQQEVFYLLHGRTGNHTKVCLLHGSFFHTIPLETLVAETFSGYFPSMTKRDCEDVAALFARRKLKSQRWTVPEASVNAWIDLQVELKPEANILNARKYPEILDNTLNLVVPLHTPDDEERYIRHMQSSTTAEQYARLKIVRIKHLLNGPFLVFQSAL